MNLDLHLADADATDALGRTLAATLPATPVVVELRGDLGAGKSTLARALLRARGVEGAIRSPTYTLIERYPLPGGECVHLDLYRIADAGELDFLALDELADARLWLIEWPERGTGALPPIDLTIALAIEGEGRRAVLTPRSDAGRAWLAAAVEAGGLLSA